MKDFLSIWTKKSKDNYYSWRAVVFFPFRITTNKRKHALILQITHAFSCYAQYFKTRKKEREKQDILADLSDYD